MQNTKSDMWLMAHSSYFKPGHMSYIAEQISRLPDEQANILLSVDLKNPTTILLFSIFLGGFGVDRFILGDIGLGIGKLLTGGGCGIWTMIDWFLVMDRAREVNYSTLMNAINFSSGGQTWTN